MVNMEMVVVRDRCIMGMVRNVSDLGMVIGSGSIGCVFSVRIIFVHRVVWRISSSIIFIVPV